MKHEEKRAAGRTRRPTLDNPIPTQLEVFDYLLVATQLQKVCWKEYKPFSDVYLRKYRERLKKSVTEAPRSLVEIAINQFSERMRLDKWDVQEVIIRFLEDYKTLYFRIKEIDNIEFKNVIREFIIPFLALQMRYYLASFPSPLGESHYYQVTSCFGINWYGSSIENDQPNWPIYSLLKKSERFRKFAESCSSSKTRSKYGENIEGNQARLLLKLNDSKPYVPSDKKLQEISKTKIRQEWDSNEWTSYSREKKSKLIVKFFQQTKNTLLFDTELQREYIERSILLGFLSDKFDKPSDQIEAILEKHKYEQIIRVLESFHPTVPMWHPIIINLITDVEYRRATQLMRESYKNAFELEPIIEKQINYWDQKYNSYSNLTQGDFLKALRIAAVFTMVSRGVINKFDLPIFREFLVLYYNELNSKEPIPADRLLNLAQIQYSNYDLNKIIDKLTNGK